MTDANNNTTRLSMQEFLQMQQLLGSQQPAQPAAQPAAQPTQDYNGNSWYGKGTGRRSCFICGVPGCWSYNHPEAQGKGGKGGKGAYGYGGWGQQPWQQQPQQPPWQQQNVSWQQPEVAPEVATPDVAAQLLQQLREKDEQLEKLRKSTAATAAAVTDVVIEEAPEVARLKEELRRKDGAAREMKRKLDEADEAMKEREMQEKLEVIERRMQAGLKQQQDELEARFGTIMTGTGSVTTTTSPPRSAASTSGFAVRSAATPWADMEEREEQKEETRRKEAEVQQLKAAARVRQQENELMKDKIRMLEALMPPPSLGAGVFPRAAETAAMTEEERLDESIRADEELIATRTSELAEWAEGEKGDEKKAEWQDLCSLHKIKKLGADWPKTPSARKKWCKRVATAEVRLTDGA
jgi:hypothetical protein